MNVQEIKALAKDIHEGNVKRGFWEGRRSLSEVLMLIRTEMSEAVEADREGLKSKLKAYNYDIENGQSIAIELGQEWNEVESKEWFIHTFRKCIKDTVEDELADTVIRILDAVVTNLIDTDYCFESLTRLYGYESAYGVETLLIEYAERFNYLMPVSYHDKRKVTLDLATAFMSIIHYCNYANIDIWWHVKEKLKYNATRPYKHGKKY